MSTTWRRALVEVVSSTTSCQKCCSLIPAGGKVVMVQLQGGDRQVEPWCMLCLFDEVAECSELMITR